MPGFERSMILFLKTGHIWGGRYLPLFSTPEMLEVHAEAELGTQLDPPKQIGEPWGNPGRDQPRDAAGGRHPARVPARGGRGAAGTAPEPRLRSRRRSEC
jgi:hypothetical protein